MRNYMALKVEKKKCGMIELWNFSEGGGPIVRCYMDGRIELFEVPQYGGVERFIGNYPTICAALAEGETWT
jgi:hypothetical protein